MSRIERIIFWCVVIWWIGHLIGCASTSPNEKYCQCEYVGEHPWCCPDLGKK
jgi:hypothetical protein